ncbi:MAG: CarD family transcriptional regulator [Clostridiales bacterium]|nr:CarD family transcriptional regulator [Clostridiales bacterium]
MMYRIDDTVIYGTAGVCKIEALEEREFSGEKRNYYVLKPLFQEGAKTYVPIDNEKLVSKIHHILSVNEAKQLVHTLSAEEMNWVVKDNERKQLYAAALEKGDRREIIALVRAVLKHKSEQMEKGKKLHICDEHFLMQALKILYDEFSFVLHISREEVLPVLMGERELSV